MGKYGRWLRPEVYPLFASVSVAVGICVMQLVRNICVNPEVRVTKENRAAGILDNHAEGETYSQHFVRRNLRNRTPQIMPSINSFFSDPTDNCVLYSLIDREAVFFFNYGLILTKL